MIIRSDLNGLMRALQDDMAFFTDFPSTTTYSYGSWYDPNKYELKLRQDFLDEEIKAIDAKIAFYEEAKKKLLQQKDKALNDG
jgi:hypothetical protein